MLQANDFNRRASYVAEAPEPTGGLDFAQIMAVAQKRWLMIACLSVLTFGLATTYAFIATPHYTAETQILIDTRKNELLQNHQVLGDQPVDAALVESQVEILKSDDVAQDVVRQLKLTEDPNFNGSNRPLLGRMVSSVTSAIASLFTSGPHNEPDRERIAIDTVTENLTAKRVGLTNVIAVSFKALSPTRAAEVANALAEGYVAGEVKANYEATKRASIWLQDSINALRKQAEDSDRAVQDFKAKNNIIDTSHGLMSEQQLADLNSQLAMARAAMAEAKARRDRILQINSNTVPGASVADALKNPVITRLRAQYLDLSAHENDLETRFGPTHKVVQTIRGQMAEVMRSIGDEMNRIAETYKSDYDIAQARTQSLQDSLNKLVGENGQGGQARVQLKELESAAQNYRALYETFLQKFTEATQQQTYPVYAARVITTALAPSEPSAPKKPQIMAGGLVVGILLGFGIAFAQDMANKSFRSVKDVERITGLTCLGCLPRVQKTFNGAVEIDKNKFSIISPFSRFAETIRSVKVSIDAQRLHSELKIIGISSSLPEEGKTTVAANLAHLVSNSGRKTLLIDADLRRPNVTKLMAPTATHGIFEVLAHRMSLADAIWVDPDTGLNILAAITPQRISNASEFLSSEAMGRLLKECREQYDYIFVDFAPMVPVVDVRAASHLIDAFVFVIEWGSTTHQSVTEAMSSSDLFRDRVLGVVLNMVDPDALKSLDAYKGKKYQNYYREV